MKTLLPSLVLTALCLSPLSAQMGQSDIKVSNIAVSYATTPEFSFQYGPKGKRSKNRDWVEVEVTFDWQPKGGDKAQKFLDELTFNYYILLNNPDFADPAGGVKGPTLLVGKSVLTAIAAGKDLKTVVYINPRTLDRFFDTKQPATANAAIKEVSVVVTRQGQPVGYLSQGKFPQNWWNTYPPIQGYVLNKNETPFAPIFWDYYEPLKAQQVGGF